MNDYALQSSSLAHITYPIRKGVGLKTSQRGLPGVLIILGFILPTFFSYDNEIAMKINLILLGQIFAFAEVRLVEEGCRGCKT